jgi:Protein of unknown function (DUF3105)
MTACGGSTVRVVSPDAQPDTTALSAEERELVDRATAAATAAGCSEVETVPPFSPPELDRAHIGGPDVPAPPPLSSYPSRPPTSGPHDPVPLPAGIYAEPPSLYRSIHSMEHAAAIIWLSPAATIDSNDATELSALADFFTGPSHGDHVIVAPYDYPDQGPAGVLPSGAAMALVAWHRLRLCQRVSLPVAFSFVLDFRFDPAAPDRYRGDAPEPGVPIG